MRNLLPDEPGWAQIAAAKHEVSDFLANQLQSGFKTAPQVEIGARKPGHGVRPLAYWGLLERVTYRALTSLASVHRAQVDRSPEAYLTFVTAPGRYAVERQPKGGDDALALLFFGETPVSYVVKSDVTAFYQFIDHAVLADELLLSGAEIEVIEALVELLAEVQGKSYGLPQQLYASDVLSEIYADRVERELLRQGFAVWRFNDDFRVACDSYAQALAAIEALDQAARRVGLVLAENKTVTVSLFRYVMDAFNLEPSAAGQALELDDVEDMVGDYTDDFGEEDADSAIAVLQRAQVRPDDVTPKLSSGDWIELRGLRAEDVRLLKRAINGLVVAADSRAIGDVVRLATYAPSLMPNLMRYLQSVGTALSDDDEAWSALIRAVDGLAHDVSLNAWQQLWLVEVIHSLDLLGKAESEGAGIEDRVTWVSDLRRDTASAPLRAAATQALAQAGRIGINEIIASAEQDSEALLHFYTQAGLQRFQRLADDGRGDALKMLRAWARTSRLHACLLAEVTE